jgi:hypothetical protein
MLRSAHGVNSARMQTHLCLNVLWTVRHNTQGASVDPAILQHCFFFWYLLFVRIFVFNVLNC